MADTATSTAALRDRTIDTIRAAVDRYEDTREHGGRLEAGRPGPDDPGRAAWLRLEGQARNMHQAAEASLAYLLEEIFRDIRPDLSPVDEGEFSPFGVTVDDVSYVVSHDPQDLSPGIITRVAAKRLADVDEILDVDGEEDEVEPAPPPPPLTLAQTIARDLGEREALDRIMLAGPYEVIRDAVRRLGTDAVRELRRMVDERRAGA